MMIDLISIIINLCSVCSAGMSWGTRYFWQMAISLRVLSGRMCRPVLSPSKKWWVPASHILCLCLLVFLIISRWWSGHARWICSPPSDLHPLCPMRHSGHPDHTLSACLPRSLWAVSVWMTSDELSWNLLSSPMIIGSIGFGPTKNGSMLNTFVKVAAASCQSWVASQPCYIPSHICHYRRFTRNFTICQWAKCAAR